jgi:hypothetical protein
MKVDRTAYPSGTLSARTLAQGVAPRPSPYLERPLVVSAGTRHSKRLAFCIPSRGTVFSHCVESVLREAGSLEHLRTALFFSHGLPIPDSHSSLVERALLWRADWTLFVEEDNWLPKGVVNALLRLDTPVAACDYFNHDGTNWVVERQIGNMDFYALGCTLISAGVWRQLGEPYLRRGKHIRIRKDGEPEEGLKSYTYGGQDIDLSFRLHRAGIKGARLEGKQWRAGHIHVVKQGSRGSTNYGFHRLVIH